MKKDLIDHYINIYKEDLKFDLIVKTPIKEKSISLYFDKDCQYSKSILWGLRKDPKQLKIVNNIDNADYIVYPKIINKIEDEIGKLRFSVLQGEVHLVEHFPNDYPFKLIDGVESKKLIIQETDLNWILKSYLDLQLIDKVVVDTIEGLLIAPTLEVDLLTNLINQLNWNNLNCPFTLELLKLFQSKFSRQFLKKLGGSKLRKSWVYILNAYYEFSKTEKYPFTFYEKDESWMQPYLESIEIKLNAAFLDSEEVKGLDKFKILEEICFNRYKNETFLEKYDLQFNRWLEKSNLSKSVKMKEYLRLLLLG